MSWPKIDVILNAIKNSSAQTVTDLKPTIDSIKTNFDEWKVPWTADRAGKIDNLDVPVSTRASEVTARNIEDNATLTLEKVRQLFPAGASKTFTTPGTHTFKVPDHVGIVTVFCVGAGGGGGGTGRWGSKMMVRGGGGGGGGGKREGTISVKAGSDLTVVVGAGGAGGVGKNEEYATGGTGGTGGSSSVGGIIATGGSGGGGGAILATGSGGTSGAGGAGGAGGILDGNPGTNGGYDGIGQGGAAPSAYGSYGRGGDGGPASLTAPLDGKDGLGGFVMISY